MAKIVIQFRPNFQGEVEVKLEHILVLLLSGAQQAMKPSHIVYSQNIFVPK